MRCAEFQVKVLLETTAGQGNSLGHRFEHLAALLELVKKPERLGVCLDTCHVFAAGYPLGTKAEYEATMARVRPGRRPGAAAASFTSTTASSRLASRVDRHAHLGQGCLGLGGVSAPGQRPALSRSADDSGDAQGRGRQRRHGFREPQDLARLRDRRQVTCTSQRQFLIMTVCVSPDLWLPIFNPYSGGPDGIRRRHSKQQRQRRQRCCRDPGMARLAHRRSANPGHRSGQLFADPAQAQGVPQRRADSVHRQHALRQHHSPRAAGRRFPAAARSNAASRAWSAGTPWPWSCGPTKPRRASAATSRPMPRPPRCTRSASTTSSAAPTRPAAATWSTSRATLRRASTPAPSSKAA